VRRPSEIERLYLDFDGFFASVEQQARPRLRGRPVGIVPFAGTAHTCVIACSREAKLRGVKNVMDVAEARRLCPEIVLIPQSPDLYRRAHNALISEISAVLPVDAIKSIDELTCRVDAPLRAEPQVLGLRIKRRIAENIGPYITCSIGFAANRQLAKMACKAGKPDGNMVWRPKDMPGPLLQLPLDAVPGIGGRMSRRLARAGITTMPALLATEPKQMRKLWGNVTGERLWYALQGYDLQAQPQGRGMYGHGRVLPPGSRSLEQARSASRLLLTKAARRMRRDGWNAGGLWLWMQFREGAYGCREGLRDDSWSRAVTLPAVHDDQAVLAALEGLWRAARRQIARSVQIVRLGVTLLHLTPACERQLDLLLDDDGSRRRWERASAAIDALNRKYGRTLVSLGDWTPPPGGYAGGKISYTRIPHAEDFW
jgi:DNA polymerase IV